MIAPILFAGPSLPLQTRQRAHISAVAEICPPASRGSVCQLVTSRKPGTIIVADGIFRHEPALGHAELLLALRAGWSVWGVSSLGAIRASEMASLGMKGYGYVFGKFCGDCGLTDDEVALVHAQEEPYTAYSEPLIHIRYFVQQSLEQGLLSEAEGECLISTLQEIHYTDRAVAHLERAIESLELTHRKTLLACVKTFDHFRIKTIDLVELMECQPWR